MNPAIERPQPIAHLEPQPPACCDSTLLARCCQPEEKSACCDDRSARGSCGCQRAEEAHG